MHELGIMANVLDLALEYSQANDVRKIRKVILEVGEYSGIMPKLAQDFFGYIAKNTIAEGAVIEIKKVPMKVRCRECGAEAEIIPNNLMLSCLECGSENLERITSGREWKLESLEVE